MAEKYEAAEEYVDLGLESETLASEADVADEWEMGNCVVIRTLGFAEAGPHVE